MRVFALSDVHADYEENLKWLASLSMSDYQEDVLILAGDISDSPAVFATASRLVSRRFAKVAYVPGNHDLWVVREARRQTSLDKLERVRQLARDCDLVMEPFDFGPVSIVPLLGWYDYSFGQPDEQLRAIWMDYRTCVWPPGFGPTEITTHFLSQNVLPSPTVGRTVISFSHFLPRSDLMPGFVSARVRMLLPIMGTSRLDAQVRRVGSSIHVYGHSHLNRETHLDGVRYVNNALGYPTEGHITTRRLRCLRES